MPPVLTRALAWLALGAVVMACLWALWATSQARDAAVERWRDAVRAADSAAREADRQHRQYELEQQRLERHRDQLARKIAALEGRVIPPAVITAPGIPDTCRAVVGALVEQVALRDSIVELKDSTIAAWDRAHAHVATQLIGAREQWAKWEHLAKVAPVRRAPRLVVDGAALVGVGGAESEARAGARVRIAGPLWAAGEYVARESDRGWRVGVRLEVPLL